MAGPSVHDPSGVNRAGDRGWLVSALRRNVQGDGSIVWQWVREEPISEAEADEVKRAIRILVEDHEQAQLNLVLSNFKTFIGYLQMVPHEYKSALEEAVNPIKRVQDELATRLFNWLQSIRAYVDHTRRRLSRRYGKDSLEIEAFREVAGREFDEHFAYRFFDQLRNYGHVDFPAINLDISEQAPLGLPREVTVQLDFNRDVLLETFDEWKSIVKADLAAQPAYFSVLPLMVEMMDCLTRVKADVGLIEREYLETCVATLDRVREKIADASGYPHLVRHRYRDDGSLEGSETVPIPPFVRPIREEGDASPPDTSTSNESVERG